ncbi:MFS transporter [Nocardia salmonicida]|uniref:MFS transporter n=1 Tax=Nocardia salmonicida TaxID=53431 RepID=UPI0033E5F5B3
MIAATFADGHERNHALGVFSMVTGFGIALGLILGGILTTVSWRLVFFVNVPIGVLTIVLALRNLTETERHTGTFDLLGAILSTLGMVGVAYGLTHGSDGWTEPGTWYRSSSASCSSRRSSTSNGAPITRSCRCGCSATRFGPVPS